MPDVERYFVGYPKPRLRLAPLAFAGIAAVLAHPATLDIKATLQPIQKLAMDLPRVELALRQPIEGTPTYSACGGPPISRRHRLFIAIERESGAKDSVAVHDYPEIWPLPRSLRRIRHGDHPAREAFLRLCTDANGRSASISFVFGTGNEDLDEWLSSRVWRWWNRDVRRKIPGRGCYVISFQDHRI